MWSERYRVSEAKFSLLLHSSNYYGSCSCMPSLLGMRKYNTTCENDGPMLTCTAKGSGGALLSSCYLVPPVSGQIMVLVPLASMFKPRTEKKPMLSLFFVSLCSHTLTPGHSWSGSWMLLGTAEVISFSKSATELENNHCKQPTCMH